MSKNNLDDVESVCSSNTLGSLNSISNTSWTSSNKSGIEIICDVESICSSSTLPSLNSINNTSLIKTEPVTKLTNNSVNLKKSVNANKSVNTEDTHYTHNSVKTEDTHYTHNSVKTENTHYTHNTANASNTANTSNTSNSVNTSNTSNSVNADNSVNTNNTKETNRTANTNKSETNFSGVTSVSAMTSLIKSIINEEFINEKEETLNHVSDEINININKLTSISNKFNIDVAVLCQEYTTIEKMSNDHIINLDEIEVTKELFQTIFYPYGENFGINKNNITSNKILMPYVSFLPEYRNMDGKKFYLLEKIISNLENDLNVSRNCFTIESLVELSNEITNLHSLCDLNYCSVLSSLTLPNILEIIKNYTMADINDPSNPLIPICVISIIFKTPTVGVKNTIVRFNYRITDI